MRGRAPSLTFNGSAQTQPVVNTYTYNRRGLLSFETSAQTGWYNWGLGYVYDTFANLHTVNYADGFSIVYAPNAIGQPTQAGPYASNISYHRNGALKQFTYGNGIVHSMSQNARQLPARSTDSGGVLDLGYVYDGNANVASITDYTTGGNQSRTLSYDTLDRLTQAVGPSFGTATYAYNVLDDITRLTVTGGNKPRDHVYNYSTGTHQLETVNNYVGGAAVIGLLYDDQGNLKNKNGQTYDFDYGNRLRDVPGKETYRYDGHGRRVYSFTTTHAVWQYSNAGQLMYSHDNRNNRKANYVYLQGSLLATREAPMSGGDGTYTVKYQHTDALGSPIKVTDAAGLTVETSEYEPYGHLANRALTDGPGFTGHVQDAGTGLTYMQQRYYDPQVGSFLSVDPVTAHSGGTVQFHRYRYAANTPYKFLDPDGRVIRKPGPPESSQNRVDPDPPRREDRFQFAEGSQSNLKKRKKIASDAQDSDGSTDWAFDVKKGAFPAGSNKCNLFVSDIVSGAGAPLLVKATDGTLRPPRAGEIANKDLSIKNWRVLKADEFSMPGDIAAYKIPGGGSAFSGHTGIMIPCAGCLNGVENISAHDDAVYNTPGQFESYKDTVYRRYTGD